MNPIREEEETLSLQVPKPLPADTEITGFPMPPDECSDLQPETAKRTHP